MQSDLHFEALQTAVMINVFCAVGCGRASGWCTGSDWGWFSFQSRQQAGRQLSNSDTGCDPGFVHGALAFAVADRWAAGAEAACTDTADR